MPRLTIALSEERHRALKEASARRGKTIGQLIEESLDYCGIKTPVRASEFVEEARQRAKLNESDAMDLAVTETREVRRDTRPTGRH